MIKQIIHWSVQQRLLVLLATLLLAAWGVFALLRTPLDAIPDLSDTQVIIRTPWQGGVWGVTEQEMHLSPLPAIISTIFPRFNLNMAMPRICLATNII